MSHSLPPPPSESTPIDGVTVRTLAMHPDDRGCFTEVFREEWDGDVDPIQWNVVRSVGSVLRGVHVHVTHSDYLVLLQGEAQVGLRDLRPHSPTAGMSTAIHLSGSNLQALTIPPGVAHGFYFPQPSMHLYSVSHYWDLDDELGCRWDDPGLEIPWNPAAPLISARDRDLPSLNALEARLQSVWLDGREA